ncbi:MAG: hypothetical protein EZS28_049046 [Streblomastix strix]|uniref:Uncharacterized protein n=1 Tax=Streblomastix strix TaxID=222440 RepID=A0A5J4TB12_9EUKA|nr:MAG: hypothetical protein EZS28_049046 [Streblomastix strix]
MQTMGWPLRKDKIKKLKKFDKSGHTIKKSAENIDFRCIIKKFEPHVVLFDFSAMQRKLEKELFKSKDEFIRKIITLKKSKGYPAIGRTATV